MHRKNNTLQNVNSSNIYMINTGDFYSLHILLDFSNILQLTIYITFTVGKLSIK